MRRASKIFSENEKKAVGQAIFEAEQKTSGEIVPVVATVSGRYDRAEDIFGILTGLAALILSWILFQNVQPVQGDWASGTTLSLGLLFIVLIFIAGFIIGTTAATYFPVLRLPFIRRKEMEEEVENRAVESFHRFHVRKTARGTGILIYVSLYERMVRVIGDSAINSKVTQKEWDSICKTIIEGMQKGNPGEGLQKSIQECGVLLANHFPVQPGDVNELTNELHLID